ncbi:cell division protein FtsL [Desulfofalx alkaliphila]|uniref:cell division protein FtsL n=1 Tax=Desulfofalx alkaliphila TaxID=105483 RepID=UPI00068C3D8A|nr:cell division protein FtsL [Desulfofalx alkaliphila]
MVLARESKEYSLSQEEIKQPPQPQRQGRRAFRRSVVKQKLVLTAMVLCCFVMGVMVAYYYAQVAYVGYKIDLLQGKLAELRIESNNLEQEVNKLVSLKQIEAIAMGELGMVRPDGDKVVLVAGTSVTPETAGEERSATHRDTAYRDRPRESITMQETPQDRQTQRNSIIQAFTEMVQRWNS